MHKYKYYLKRLIIIAICVLFIGCTSFNTNKFILSKEGYISVHYIDVGQGDSILINVNNKNLLIDSGPTDSESDLLSYLDSLKIHNLDYVIATHPHEDHIGNMSKIIDKYNVISFYSPKVSYTSKCFEDMITSLKNKNLKIHVIKEGTHSINLGTNTLVTVYSPINTTYDDNYNNYSPIIKIQFGKISFMFTGDAEELVEKQVLNSYKNLKSNVLKVGHHGSSSSSCKEFINAVDPSIFVISVGRFNDYNHPSKTTLDLLNSYDNKKIFRTDLNGTIIIRSDGLKLFGQYKKIDYCP